MKKKIAYTGLGLAVVVAGLLVGNMKVRASDHDDGETDIKGRNLNLTDLFVFREDWQTGTAGDASNLILIMNSNPRSLPGQQYFFSTAARYEFHASRAGTDNSVAGTSSDNVVLRFEFAAPDANNAQAITMTTIVDGNATVATGAALTTPIANAASPVTNTMTAGGTTFSVFAGHREDPFFFDVVGFFKFRAAFAGGASFAAAAGNFTGDDFTTGYNVNSIVVRVPVAFFQTASETVLDFWETISIPF